MTKKKDEKPKGHYGCPKCRCQAAKRAVDLPCHVPVMFRVVRVTNFYSGTGKMLDRPKKGWFWDAHPLGEVTKKESQQRLLLKFECVECGHKYEKPKFWRAK